MWERRIQLMGGFLAFVRFAETQRKVWDVLNDPNPPAMLVIDPLQQFLKSGGKNDEAVQNNLNEMTRHAAKNNMAIVCVMHWKEHYRDKLVGSEAVKQVVKVIHKIEQGRGKNNWILRRVRSQNAQLNEFVRFHTYKLNPNDPVLAKFDTRTWEAATLGKEGEEEEIEPFILETTEGAGGYPTAWLLGPNGDVPRPADSQSHERRGDYAAIIATQAGVAVTKCRAARCQSTQSCYLVIASLQLPTDYGFAPRLPILAHARRTR